MVRLWSLHPKYLDRQGLVALWRETLLAQAVLAGATQGYRHHPQLVRFQEQAEPLALVAEYLRSVLVEATRRGYRFAAEKIQPVRTDQRLTVTSGQLDFEGAHLRRKLAVRDPERLRSLPADHPPDPHPLFDVVAGDVAPWEKVPSR